MTCLDGVAGSGISVGEKRKFSMRKLELDAQNFVLTVDSDRSLGLAKRVL
jgi:hypothetical protein